MVEIQKMAEGKATDKMRQVEAKYAKHMEKVYEPVKNMIEKMNAHQSSSKPFTLLEIKPFLQKLHDASRIFMVEDEGNMGVVYSV